jgi:hypothetical protein
VGTVPAGYTAEDPDGLTDEAVLTITVVPDTGNMTVANDDASSGAQGQPQGGNVLSNDFDPEGDNQTVTSALADTDGDGLADDPLTIGVATRCTAWTATGTWCRRGRSR